MRVFSELVLGGCFGGVSGGSEGLQITSHEAQEVASLGVHVLSQVASSKKS